MYPSRLPLLILQLFLLLLQGGATSATQKFTVQVWPLDAASPSPLLSIVYDAATLSARSTSYTPPTKLLDSSSPTQLVRVGYLRNPRDQDSWTGVVVSSKAFDKGHARYVELLLGPDDEVLHVGFQAAVSSDDGAIGVKVVRPSRGPLPELERPLVVDESGRVPQKEPEKSLLQKYWWLFIVMAVFAMMGGGDK
ncbi:MAG: hypothetical protein M1825_002151 [Sarcosagium campestre]|nr:MAG: hypothetical protein M1825_002151 [Sarcosagium campestre]